MSSKDKTEKPDSSSILTQLDHFGSCSGPFLDEDASILFRAAAKHIRWLEAQLKDTR
jgi:hypothetical protein